MKDNKVTIVSILFDDNSFENYYEIKISNQCMILVKIDFNNNDYWFWLNNVTEKSYSIGNSNIEADDFFYSEMFKILKDYREEINLAKSKLLDLLLNKIIKTN